MQKLNSSNIHSLFHLFPQFFRFYFEYLLILILLYTLVISKDHNADSNSHAQAPPQKGKKYPERTAK